MSRFPLIRLLLSGIFMKIISVRQRLYPALLLPLT
ncbi:Plug domain-containing protein, partial [Salmonella enterica subsp. enterica serovar Typhimurium]